MTSWLRKVSSSELRSPASLPRVARRTLALAWEADPRGFVAAGLISMVDALLPAASVEITRRVVSSATDGRLLQTKVVALLAVLALIVSVTRTANVIRTNLVQLLGAKTGAHASHLFLQKVADLGPAHLDDPDIRDRMERASKEITTKPNRMVSSTLSGLVGIGILMTLGGTLASIQPVVALLALASVVPIAISQRFANRYNFEYRRHATIDERRAAYLVRLVTDRASGLDFHISGAGSAIVRRYRSLNDQLLRRQERALARGNYVQVLGGVISGGILTIGFIVASSEISDRRMGPGDIAAFILSLSLLALYFALVINSLSALQNDALFVQEFFDFLEMSAGVARPLAVGSATVQLGPLEFSDVSFSYPNTAVKAVESVSFRVEPGQMLAMVGSNGAGKSTIVRLLVRLYDPAAGSITLGGTNIRDFDPDELRARISVLFQEPTRVEFCVRDAIQLSRWNESSALMGTDADVWAALERAGAGQMVRRFSSGLDTQLGVLFPRGKELSGGEWQRLALARAYYRDAWIMVLDEPTASLDPVAELAVFDEVRRGLGNTIAIVISHRFATVRSADLILVLDSGKIVEVGTHEELMHLDGRYAFLFEMQAVGYR